MDKILTMYPNDIGGKHLIHFQTFAKEIGRNSFLVKMLRLLRNAMPRDDFRLQTFSDIFHFSSQVFRMDTKFEQKRIKTL